MVTLFILYQKSSKRNFGLIQSSLSIIQHHKYEVHIANIFFSFRQEEAKQTADCFSDQTRSCTAQGELGEEDRPDEAGGECPAGGRHSQGHSYGKGVRVEGMA